MRKRASYEIEIRDTDDHYSNSADGDSGVNVLQDTLHPNEFWEMSKIRIYIDDDHDASFDVIIEHTHVDDENWNAPSQAQTLSIGSGEDQGTAWIDGPAGQLRIHFQSGSLTSSPTSGSCFISILTTHTPV